MNPADVLLRPLRRLVEARARRLSRRRTAVVEVDGVALIVLPDVYDPVLHQTGMWLARAARQAVPTRPEHASRPRVLDLGTGCGIGAVFTALRGADVVATDLSPEAVRNARLNAQLHHVESRIDVRQGDLFAPANGERFDLVLFDPPRYQGRPATFLDLAWRGDAVVERFLDGVGDALRPGGAALVVVSSEGASRDLPTRLRERGLTTTEVSRAQRLGASWSVVRASR